MVGIHDANLRTYGWTNYNHNDYVQRVRISKSVSRGHGMSVEWERQSRAVVGQLRLDNGHSVFVRHVHVGLCLDSIDTKRDR